MNTYKRLQIPLQPATKTSTNKNIFGSSVLQQNDDTIKIVIQAQNLSHSEMFKAYLIVSHNGQYVGIHIGNLTTKGNTSELKKEYTKTIDNTLYTINDIVAITVELDGKYNNLTLLVGYPKGYVNCINNYSTNVRNMTTLKPTKSATNDLTSSSTTTTNNTTTTYTSPIPTLYDTPHHSSHSTTTYDNHHDHHHTSHSTTTYDNHHDHHHTSHSTTTYDHHHHHTSHIPTTTYDNHHDHHHTSHSTTTYDHHHHHTSHIPTTTYDNHHDHHHTSHSTTTYDHHNHHHNNIGNSPTNSKQATKATTNDFYNELLFEPTQETTLETVINKLKEELNSLKELSTATKEDLNKKNKEFIKQSKINTQENMNFMLKNNESIKPFTQQNKDIDWVVIHTNELVILHKDYWQLFWDDFVCDCYNTHGHLIFGNYIEDDLEYYVLGVPTHYDPHQVRLAQNLGFFQFKPCDNSDLNDNVFGYWLLQIKY